MSVYLKKIFKHFNDTLRVFQIYLKLQECKKLKIRLINTTFLVKMTPVSGTSFFVTKALRNEVDIKMFGTSETPLT